MRQARAALVLGMLLLPRAAAARPLTLDERIAYQAAIEQVYWRHRIWPKENPGPKPPFEELMPPHVLREKVEDYLRKSNALEVYWKRPVTGAQLQAEMDRMARDTRDPAMLHELFAALDNDPGVIAECLARPTLVDRLIHSWYARDSRFHGEVRAAAERDLARVASVEDLRGTSGTYQEVEWRRDDGSPRAGRDLDDGVLWLTAEEWDEWRQRLAAAFGRAGACPPPAGDVGSLPLRRVGTLQEDDGRFWTSAVVDDVEDRVRVATVAWPRLSFEAWWRDAGTGLRTDVAEPAPSRSVLPSMKAALGCTVETWTPMRPALEPRSDHSAVWTGIEMIVWGGIDSTWQPTDTGARYSPATDTWVASSTGIGVPSARRGHTAVWTGTEMIVWGGGAGGGLSTGGRYDPVRDTWRSVGLVSAPSSRWSHTAVWTGSEMIVWGGGDTIVTNSGGRYDPVTDSWRATSTGPSVPGARRFHVAVWTGGEMVVWGGSANPLMFDTGSRYDPVSDSWRPTSMANVPAARHLHASVWTGSEMVIWGGYDGSTVVATGGRYDPSADSWTGTSTGANVPGGREYHTAVWTGSEMVIWGGAGYLDTGGRYDPATDTWRATSTGANVPSGRYVHTAVWTGAEMIVWGGFTQMVPLHTGGRYDPSTDSWVPTSTTPDTPVARRDHTAVWTGSEMIAWGGRDARGTVDSGGRYDLATDTWTATSTGPAPRYAHTAVWTGGDMIVWGGRDGPTNVGTGGRYRPSTDRWLPTSTGTNAPSPRWFHSAVWSGAEMIVWGGSDSVRFLTGGRYDPLADSWLPTNAVTAPAARHAHTAVWTGSEMIVWGGYGASGALFSGARYNPGMDSWMATGTGPNLPSARRYHTAVWTGSKMIIWGGESGGMLDTGGQYDPVTDAWSETSTGVNLPTARRDHTAVWTGSTMIVWGGTRGTGWFLDTGGRYDSVTDTWLPTSTAAGVPASRTDHTAVWTGQEMIVWAGYDNGYMRTGALYCAGSSRVDYLVGQGLGAPNANEVRVHDRSGTPTGVDFFAYAAGQWGVNVAGADVELGAYEGILTGPGPGTVFGPHVRAFRRNGVPIAKVSFYAYGTLRYGANVASGSTDADAYDEIVTGAGPGAVFGPHVRGFDYDNTVVTANPKVSFFAYGTLKYGVNVSSGDVDGDGFDELVTGAGPSPAFASTVRGFDVDGGPATAIAKINANAFSYAGYGVNVAGGNVDADAYDEIAATPGPGPTHPSRYVGLNYDAAVLSALPGFDVTPAPFSSTAYGGRVAAGDVTGDGREDLLCGAGRDPAADARVLAFDYAGTLVPVPATPFDPFPGRTYGVNVGAAATGY